MAEGAFWNNYKGTARPATTTISSPNASGANTTYRGTAGNSSVAADPFIADLIAMSDQDRLLVSELLVKSGYLRTPTSKYNKKLGDAYQQASNDWQVESARTGREGFTFRQFLQENAAAPAGATAANIPTRQIYDVPKIQIEDDVNTMAQNILGRTITDADKQQDWYNDLIKGINKMYQSGTLTTVKNVKNKKTGKMEKQVIQEPGFSKEKITERITTTLEQADPLAVERKKNLEFANWAIQKMGGGR